MMKHVALLLLLISLVCTSEIKLFNTIKGETNRGEVHYYHFNNKDVPNGHQIVLQSKGFTNDTTGIAFRLKYNQRPTVGDFDASILLGYQLLVNNKEGVYHVGAFSQSFTPVKFELYLFLIKKETVEERLTKEIKFEDKSYFTLQNLDLIYKSSNTLEINCNSKADLYARTESRLIPNHYSGLKFDVKKGDNKFIFDQTGNFLISILASKGTKCELRYSVIFKYAYTQIKAKRGDSNIYDYFVAKLEAEYGEKNSFISSLDGKELTYYVNYGDDPNNIPYPSKENYQLKSKVIKRKDRNFGAVLTVPKEAKYAIYGVHGGEKNQIYEFSPLMRFHQVSFKNTAVFQLSASKPQIFYVRTECMQPNRVALFVKLAKKSTVTLILKLGTRSIRLIDSDKDFKVLTPPLTCRNSYQLIFEGENDLHIYSSK